MSGHPFSKNIIDNVFVPTIVSSDDGYAVELNMEHITNIGTSEKRVDNIWVNTLHFIETDPVISGGGGGGGQTGPQGIQGPTGLQGIPGPTGPPGDSNGSGVSISGPPGQIPFFSQNGLTSSPTFNITNNLLTTPNTNISNQSILSLSTNQTSNIQSGQFPTVGSGNSLLISDIGNQNITATFDTLNSRVGIKTEAPSYDLDVNGQTRISYSGSKTGFKTSVIASGTTGNINLNPGNYNIYSWGQGGYGNGGGAGYLNASLDINSNTALNWTNILGGLGSFNGGSATSISLGSNLLAVVPGGGGGTTLSQGAWYGSLGGSPMPISGYSATETSGGTGGSLFIGNSLVTIDQPFNANVTNIQGKYALSENTSCFIPAGTQLIAVNNSYIIDNVNSTGIVVFQPTSFMSAAVVNAVGITSLTFSNVSVAPSSNTSIIANPFRFQTSNLIYQPFENNTTNIISDNNGISETNQAISIPNINNILYPVISSFNCYPSDIQRFVTSPGYKTSGLVMTITDPSSYNNVSIDTQTNSATFTRDTTVKFNTKILTNNSTFNISSTSFSFPTGIKLAVSQIITNGVAGSFLTAGPGVMDGAGGGGGYYGGGGGIDGGGGGAGSGYIASIDNNIFSGNLQVASGKYTSFSKYNNSTTAYGWAGTNPSLPYTIIEQVGITLTNPDPALIVDGDLLVTDTLNIGKNTVITTQPLGSSGGNLTIIEQQTSYSVNDSQNSILIRPTSGPPQGLFITHQTNQGYTNDCLVDIDGDLTVKGDIGCSNLNSYGTTQLELGLNVGGSVTLQSGLNVAGEALFQAGGLISQGGITCGSDIFGAGSGSFIGNLSVLGTSTLTSAFISSLENGSLGMSPSPPGGNGSFVIAGLRIMWGYNPVNKGVVTFDPPFSLNPFVYITSINQSVIPMVLNISSVGKNQFSINSGQYNGQWVGGSTECNWLAIGAA
jgi:hypothetical protein